MSGTRYRYEVLGAPKEMGLAVARRSDSVRWRIAVLITRVRLVRLRTG
jgi:hypothetical protein